LWAHKTYNAHPAVEFVFALGGAFALQNSALHWSSDHRVHHGQVDDPIKDPYAATNGFGIAILAGCYVTIKLIATAITVTVAIYNAIKL